MLVKQISVFVENKPGRILDIIEAIGNNGIDISALSVADTAEFGIIRMIVNNAELAKTILIEKGVIVKITDVITIAVNDEPGGLVNALKLLKNDDVVLEYMYAFVGKVENNSLIVMRTDDQEKAILSLKNGGIKILTQEDINKL